MNQIIIHENNFDKARKLIKENHGKKIIFSSDKDELNRKILEKEDINILLLNQEGRKDFQKQRNSGFNHIMAKLAKGRSKTSTSTAKNVSRKKDVIIGINLDEIIKSNEKEKARILARVIQNIRICNKNKLKMKFLYKNQKRNIYDLKSLGLVLGMPTWMASNLAE